MAASNCFFKPAWVAVGLLLSAVLCVYWPGLSGGYLFDDYPVIFKNSQIQIVGLDWSSIKQALNGFSYGEYGRPLATLSFALNYLADGVNPWGYKLVGLVIHVLNTFIVWRLLSLLVRLPASGIVGDRADWFAFACASLWALHPLQVSSVLYVVQRMEVFATTFVLVALLLYVKAREKQRLGEGCGWWFMFFSGVSVAVGMLSKETAVLAALYALCLELTILGFEAKSEFVSRALKSAYCLVGFVGFCAAIYLCLKYADAETYSGRWFSADERVLTQFRVLPLYLGQILFPAPGGMHFYYDDVVASRSIFDPITTLLGALLCAGLLFSAFLLRHRAPFVALGIFWFFAGHVLTSSPINLELIFEHRNYFALLGVVIAVASGALILWRDMDVRLLLFASFIVVIGLSGLTALRSATWGDSFLLALELAQENRSSPRAATDLGEQYMLLSGMRPDSPFYGMARDEYRRASALPQASPLPESGLILLLGKGEGVITEDVWVSLQKKIRKNPLGAQEKLAVESLLMQYYDGLPIDAEKLDETIALMLGRFRPDAPAYSKYADFILRSGRGNERAVGFYLKAFEASGKDWVYLKRLQADLVSSGYADAARELGVRARQRY